MNTQQLIGVGMLLAMFVTIFAGIPISFLLLFLAVVFGIIGLGAMSLDLAYLQVLGMMKQDEFIAVPMFILMGYICEQAGVMSRMFVAFRDLLAPMRGSLYMVVLLTATLFGIAAGTVGATVALIGIIAGPMMIKSGYDAQMSAGAITAGGTLGILIPPSVMLVVMGPVLGVSIIDLYLAAFGPGFLMAAMYILYTVGRCFLNPRLGPPVPPELRTKSRTDVLYECLRGLVPITVLTVVTLGSILIGMTTATEAAALGCVGAVVMVAGYGKLTLAGLVNAGRSTLLTTSMVMLLAVASNVFGAVFSRLGTADWVVTSLVGLSLPPMAMLFLALVIVFLLGWPFEWPAIVLIFLPILTPVMQKVGIDMVWFGVLVAMVLQTAFLSPPVAMSAYYLKQVVREWSLGTIYRGMMSFMAIQCVAVALVVLIPPVAMWLPNWLKSQQAVTKKVTGLPQALPTSTLRRFT